MNKYTSTLLLFIFCLFQAYSQKSTSRVPISVTKSQNGIYSIKSISYDTEFPNLKGQSIVYENNTELYRINRSFDFYTSEKYTVALSNDGKTVIYLVNDKYWPGAEFENVTVYRNGTLAKTYNMLEFTGCDSKKEECFLFYNNYYEILDLKKSKAGTKKFKEVFKKGTSKEDIFLSKNYVVLNDDVMYLTDSRAMVTSFDLNKMEVIRTVPFYDIYPDLVKYAKPQTTIKYYNASGAYIQDFVDLNTQEKISQTISKLSGLKYIPLHDSTFHKYKSYEFELKGYLNKSGKFEIDVLKTDDKFDKKQIINFLTTATFKSDFIPKEVDKQYFMYFFGGFRNANDSIAAAETTLAQDNRQKEFVVRQTLDSINGIYIPKNLQESVLHLDTVLDFTYKTKIKEATNIWEFNSHMSPLGIWIRNNWGINGGSRLSKYFNNRGITDRDAISEIIISSYQKWILSDKEVWLEWEAQNPTIR